MNKWTSIRLAVVTLLVCYVCFAYTNIFIRVLSFLVAVFFAINAYCFFEHAVLFRNKWQTATTGKRRTPPGPSVVAGSIFLALAIGLMVYCFH